MRGGNRQEGLVLFQMKENSLKLAALKLAALWVYLNFQPIYVSFWPFLLGLVIAEFSPHFASATSILDPTSHFEATFWF